INARFLVEGHYFRNSNLSNLNLYLQIYDPDTKTLVDAFSINDDIYQLEDLELDKKELKEDDGARINKFLDKSIIHIISNPNKKENRENIELYALNTPIAERVIPFTKSEEEASEEQLEEVFDLLKGQITTSTTKTAKKTNEAPNIVSVISDKELNNFGRVSVNDVLYQLPGFAPSQTNDKRSVSARGMFEGWNNNHLLILVDGVQFNELFYGTAPTWAATPLNMVKSMEVIRGPGSALYGSNATNGVVSLNTYTGDDLKGEIRIRTRMGDYGTKIHDFLTGNSGKLFSHVLSYNSYETNGNEFDSYDGSDRTDIFGFLRKFPNKDNHKSYYLFSKIEGKDFLKGLSFQYHRQSWQYQTFDGWLYVSPDIPSAQREGRDVFIAKYSNNITSKLSHEYVFRYMNNFWDYSTRFYPNGIEDYPAGVTENVKTRLDNLFLRAQITYLFGGGASFVGGVEASQTKYLGDTVHNSNIDMNYWGTEEPHPGNLYLPLNPIMDWITDKPIYKVATFAQLTSGKIWNKIEFTFGVRYDESINKFKGIDSPYSGILGSPTIELYDPNLDSTYTYSIPGKFMGPPFYTNEKKVFRRTSPRVGIVYFVSDRLTFKAMAGRAFREPSPGELYGVNTYVGGSNNPRSLSPEIIKTGEVAMDWIINQHFNFRINGFQTRFENVIDYSGTSNAISNVYTLGTRGVESEVLLKFKNISGFVNYSRFFRYIDSNLDSTISKHPKEVTLTPGHNANFGISGNWEKWISSISVQRQGRVARQLSDLGEVDPLTGQLLENKYSDPNKYPTYRSKRVPAWNNVNFRLIYKITGNVQLGFNIFNALNSQQNLLHKANYPYDYLRDGRRVQIDLSARF
ncbi:MAG: TonB-dependent receptor, partial [Leptospiraceae bacterium]|nr:TonB-dependent receptor [Leptospiraceae bacterium]